MNFINEIKQVFIKYFEWLLFPFTFAGGILLRGIRRHKSKLNKNWNILKRLKVIPIIDHYYEPLISEEQLSKPLGERNLAGINYNIEEQLQILSQFTFEEELRKIPLNDTKIGKGYFFNNGNYQSGDGEYLYSMIRYYKPSKIIEIGSGYSTLMSLEAIKKNCEDDKGYNCKMICIEPYEQPWLSQKDVTVIRERVENIDLELFRSLNAGDILFIDSSHVIRAQGDVLYEYLEIMPNLQKGVFIHIHDILTPMDYPHEWMFKEVRLWNEQYLFEAFLTCNNAFTIIGSLNHLWNHYNEKLCAKCPNLKRAGNTTPPYAFWIRKDQ